MNYFEKYLDCFFQKLRESCGHHHDGKKLIVTPSFTKENSVGTENVYLNCL